MFLGSRSPFKPISMTSDDSLWQWRPYWIRHFEIWNVEIYNFIIKLFKKANLPYLWTKYSRNITLVLKNDIGNDWRPSWIRHYQKIYFSLLLIEKVSQHHL